MLWAAISFLAFKAGVDWLGITALIFAFISMVYKTAQAMQQK
jgi:hypothetical protein